MIHSILPCLGDRLSELMHTLHFSEDVLKQELKDLEDSSDSISGELVEKARHKISSAITAIEELKDNLSEHVMTPFAERLSVGNTETPEEL